MTSAPTVELLYPLPLFYDAVDHPLPDFELVDPAALPPAAHKLLVHNGDMTSRLEKFFADEMALRVLQCDHTPDHYRREVVLYCEKSGKPVEYGAIEIELGVLDETLRSEIIAGHSPLGGLLNRHHANYRSRPRGFLRVAPDRRLTEIFELPAPVSLYGRTNQLLDAQDRVFANIVEVLRPV